MKKKPAITDALKHTSMAALLRTPMAALAVFSVDDLDCYLWDRYSGVTSAHKKRIRGTITDMRNSGEVKTHQRTPADGRRSHFYHATYVYVGRKPRRLKIDIIWHLVRSARSGRFTHAEIVRLSGAKDGTVQEYLSCLVDLGICERTAPGRFCRLRDPGPDTPVNAAKCKKLQRLRHKKKRAAQVDRLRVED